MGYELVYKEIGDFGLYQKYVVSVLAYAGIYAGLLYINSVFVLGVPKHRCALPGWDNDTYDVQSSAHLAAINATIPPASDTTNSKVTYDGCHYYTDDTGSMAKCDKWVYDKSMFTSSLAADLNMVCDRSIMIPNAQMLFFGGVLAGSILTGLFSDRFGRKPTLCLSSLFYFGAALALAWSSTYEMYAVLRFTLGFFASGNSIPCHVMSMEFAGPSKRFIAGTVGSFTWIFGNILLAGVGYGIRDWFVLQLVCASTGILFQLWWILLPESPRWLYSQGRFAESEKVLRKAARWNKVQLPDKFFDKVFNNNVKTKQGKIWQLFIHRTLCIRTLVIYFNWFVVSMTYYGLALNSVDLGGDFYLHFFVQALMALPSNIMVLLLLNVTGRKPLLVGSMLLGGLSCLGTVFTIIHGGPEYQTATTTLAMIGQFGASAAFAVVYVFSGELFPTVVRNAGMGSSSCMARVGGMIAPYIAHFDSLVGGSLGKALPQIVFGTLAVLAGIFSLVLPETLNKGLPESIQDGIDYGKENKELATEKEDGDNTNEAFEDEDRQTKL